MLNLNNLNNLGALGVKGSPLFDPSSINVNGEKTLLQQVLTKQSPTIDGLIYDERKNKGDARPIQVGRDYLFDGVNDEVICGNVGTVNKFIGYIRFVVDNQNIFSLTNSTTTRLRVNAGVLEAGASLTISSIRVDGVTRTASEAGILLNDNVFRLLEVEFTSTSATNLILGHGGGGAGTFGNIEAFGWQFLDGSTLRAFYKMDEQTGTTSYDSSGNGRHGTITNATLGTFHSTQNVYSYQNEVGYTLSGSVFVPRNEAIPTQDVLGGALQFKGGVPYNAVAKGASCVSFNGTNQYIETSVGLSLFNDSRNAFKIRARIIPTSVTGARRIVAQQDGPGGQFAGVSLYTNGTNLILDVIKNATGGVDQLSAVANGLVIATNTYYDIEVTYTGNKLVSGVSWVINGVAYSSSVGSNTLTTNNITSVSPFRIGADLDGRFFEGRIFGVQVFDGSNNKLLDMPLAEGSGLIANDITGNLRGILINTPTWSTQDRYFYNLAVGFSKYMYFDGVNDFVDVGAISAINTADFILEGKFQCVLAGGVGSLFEFGKDVNSRISVYITPAGRLGFYIARGGGDVLVDNASSPAVNDGFPHSFQVTVNRNGNVSMLLDGSPYGTTTNISARAGSLDTIATRIGAFPFLPGLSLFRGVINSLVLKNISGTVINSWNGYGNANINWTDQVGSNNGTVNGSPLNLRIPAISTTLDRYGNPLRNGAGPYHDDAGATIDFTGGVLSPEAVRNSWETAWAFNTARTNPEFRRTLTLNGIDHRADRFLAYRNTLSGSNLTKVQKYTATKAI